MDIARYTERSDGRSTLKGIIYKITNLLNEKAYVGQTIRPLNKRIGLHRSQKSCVLLHRAIQKYGIDNFKWEKLKEYDTKEMADILETFCIMAHKTHNTEGGYNLTWGGEGTNGCKRSRETIRKAIETKRRNGNHIPSAEARRNMSEAHKGHSPSEESIRKRIESMRRNGNDKRTEETKRKMSEACMGPKNHRYGKQASKETRRRMTESQQKRWEERKTRNGSVQ